MLLNLLLCWYDTKNLKKILEKKTIKEFIQQIIRSAGENFTRKINFLEFTF